jgi:citrate lyase subunit beta/citryl-CoA lyase
MSTGLPPVRSWLYAPGNNPRLLDKVFGAGSDAVILDLEDAVPPTEKERARGLVAETLAGRPNQPGPVVFVRINHPDGPLAEADIAAVVQPGLAGLRLPKVESPESVRRVERLVAAAERHAGLPPGSVVLVCNIESAAGVWWAADIARSSPRVLALAFGAADFVRDVGATVGGDGLETLYARSRLVLAARVAGVRPPVDSVYTRLDDEDGLERTTRQGRDLGFFGRSAIHPRQIPVINRAYTPGDEEVSRAREVVTAARSAEATGSGALRMPNGEFVDVAIVRRAEAVLRLAEALGAPAGG